MRAAVTERFFSKFGSNVHRHNHNSINHAGSHGKALIAQPSRKFQLLSKFMEYVKSWTKPSKQTVSKLIQGTAEDNQLVDFQHASVETQMQKRIPTIKMVPEDMHRAPIVILKPCPPITPELPKNSIDASRSAINGLYPTNSRATNSINSIAMPPVSLMQITNNEMPRTQGAFSYPVLPLEGTIDRYLKSIKPFFDKEKYLIQEELAYNFMTDKGRKLQLLLEEAGRGQDNWLTDRWITATYLRNRAPLTVYSNPCIAFPLQKFTSIHDYVDFGAKAIYAICKYHKLVKNNEIPVPIMDGYQLDNSQFHNVFGTVRLPQRCCDCLQQCDSNYVVIVHKNNFFKMIVHSEKGKLLNVLEFKRCLLKIIRSKYSRGMPIGLLTHDKRDNWCEAHELLERDPANAKALQCIEQSLFTVSLDERVDIPKDRERAMQINQILHGGGSLDNSANRWMDKSLQLIINPNGIVGFCCEVSPSDPQPAASIMDYVLSNINNPEYGMDYGLRSSGKMDIIQFEATDALDTWLKSARQQINEIAGRFMMHTFHFNGFGRQTINLKGLAPDSFVQLALQLAYYRLHNELPAQQESAHLRIFRGGRSDVIRSTTNESLRFVKAMTTADASTSTRQLAMWTAIENHRQLSKLVMYGHGVDRHLFGLLQMALEHGKHLPRFFYSAGYLQSTNYRIVTSQITTPHDAIIACGPLNYECYSCSYNVRDTDMKFAVSAWDHNSRVSSKKFCNAIRLALTEMEFLFNQNVYVEKADISPGRMQLSKDWN